MARGFTIKETDIYKLIIEEMNDSAFSGVIQFSFADWITNTDIDGNVKGLTINRFALNSNGKFDLTSKFNETTYANEKNSFVAMTIAPLNGELTALNTIKDVVCDTSIEFLVCADNINIQQAITLAIEEVRARFIQYQTTLDVSYVDLTNTSSKTRIEETLKVIMMSGTIDYGSFVQINSKNYLTYTLPIIIRATNFGEFANQQKIYIGVDSILDDNDDVIMHLLEPNEWFYGTARGVESVMLLPDKASSTQVNQMEIKSIQKDKGFAFNLDVQMDLQDTTVGTLLRHFYKDSLQESLVNHIYTIKIEMYLYNSGTGLYTIDNDLTVTRLMTCTQNQPNESLSKGEKIVYSLVFVPYYNKLVV